MTTDAPSSASRWALANPIPEHPPVTTATLPCTLPGTLSAICRPVCSACSVLAEEDVLLLSEGVRSVGSQLATQPGLFITTERGPVTDRGVRVHTQIA